VVPACLTAYALCMRTKLYAVGEPGEGTKERLVPLQTVFCFLLPSSHQTVVAVGTRGPLPLH
jgi:hypothetical protein